MAIIAPLLLTVLILGAGVSVLAVTRRLRALTDEEISGHPGDSPWNEALGRALGGGRTFAWQADLSSGRISYAYEGPLFRELGATLEFLPGKLDEVIPMIHLEDRGPLSKAFRQMSESGSIDGEYRVLLPGGRPLWAIDEGPARARQQPSHRDRDRRHGASPRRTTPQRDR